MLNTQSKIVRHVEKQENVIRMQEGNLVSRGPEITEMREQAKTSKVLNEGIQVFKVKHVHNEKIENRRGTKQNS